MIKLNRDSKKLRKLSSKIYEEFKKKPEYNRPYEFLDVLKHAKKTTGLYPVYSGRRSAEKFIRFISENELTKFAHFNRPRWKKHEDCFNKDYGLKIFSIEIADTYAGNLFPDRTPYLVNGRWRKGGLYDGEGSNVEYEVAIFTDCGHHIDTQTIKADKPLPLKKVLEMAVEKSYEIKGKCFDGYWY